MGRFSSETVLSTPSLAVTTMRLALACVLALPLLAPTGAAFGQSDATQGAKPAKPKREQAERKKAQTSTRKEAAAGPKAATQVAVFGDWAAYTAENGPSKMCFAQSEPKSRSPASLKDTKAYLFVSFRPAEKVANELAAVLNFKTKEEGPAVLAIGDTKYELITKGEHAWVKNPADEAAAIGSMVKGSTLLLQTISARGNKTSDRYSLSGFSQALERARSDCR